MAVWRIAITNPKTGQYHGYMSFKEDVRPSIENFLNQLEEETPIGDLPDNRSLWIVEAVRDPIS